MKKFTVLLLYPDYIAETFGHETYLTSVDAEDVNQAIALSRAEMGKSCEIDDPDDLFVLAVFAGDHDDIKP